MTDEPDQYEIGFAAIIFWDYVDESDEEELLKCLAELYGEEPDQYGGATFDGGGWRARIAGNNTNQIEDNEEFESVRTRVESGIRGILDVTTFAVLSEKQIRMVRDSERRRGIRELESNLSEYLKDLPSYVEHDKPDHCGLYYAEWNEGDLLSDLKDPTEEDIVEHLSDQSEALHPFGFQVGGNLSLYNENCFVSPTAIMDPFGGLAVIRRRAHPDSGPIDELITDPAWYVGISGLARYYRLNQWSDSRWGRLAEFGSDADDARESLSSLSSTQTDVDMVLPVSEEIQDLQIEYTEFKTRFNAEYQSVQDSFSERADDVTDTWGNPIDVPLPRPNEPDIVEQPDDRTNSLIEYFEDASQDTLEQMNDRFRQVTKKVDSLVSSIESRTRITATDENLRLQKRVRRLTVILVILTVILVAAELL